MSSVLYCPIGTHTTNSSLSSAVSITAPDSAEKIWIQAFTNNIRWTMDGTTPTASTGFQLIAGSIIEIDFNYSKVVTIKVIEETASASIQYQFFQTTKDTV